MKFRRNKIKREHHLIDGALEWLEELSKNKEVTDIIPGVINVTHSKERGIFYQYETDTGCKVLMKKGGAIQEAFVVTKHPQLVQTWIAKQMEELDYFQKALADDQVIKKDSAEQSTKKYKPAKSSSKSPKVQGQMKEEPDTLLMQRDRLLAGMKEEVQLVEINQGLRDSLVESLASMGDLDPPKIEDVLQPITKEALEKLQEKLGSKAKWHKK